MPKAIHPVGYYRLCKFLDVIAEGSYFKLNDCIYYKAPDGEVVSIASCEPGCSSIERKEKRTVNELLRFFSDMPDGTWEQCRYYEPKKSTENQTKGE